MSAPKAFALIREELKAERALKADLLNALQLVLADCQDIDTDSCISLGVGEQVLAAINKATGGATP